MRTGSILFLCGIVCLLHSPTLPPLYLTGLIPLCLILALHFRLLVWPMCFVCGLLWAVFRADIVLQDKLAPELEDRHLTIEGRIISLPTRLSGGQRFVFAVHGLIDEQGREHAHPGKVRLSWYGAVPELVPGDHWRFRVKLKRPHGFMNPGGFDYEAWLFQQGIRATGYVTSKTRNQLLRQGDAYYLHRLRYHMRERLDEALSTDGSASLVPALVIGDRSAIQSGRWRTLTATGTNHLLAISGLHIGLISGIVYFLTRWIWPLGRITALILPAPKMAAIAAMLAALCYAAMAGFSIPTQRALIMLMVLLATTFMSRKVVPSSIISLALLLVLVIDPFAVLSAGFWLSFSAIAVIAYGMSARIDATGLWWRWGRVQYLVAVGLLPLLVLWFQQIPLLSVAANLLVVPWVSFITVPLVLFGSVVVWLNNSIGSWFLQLGTVSIDLFWPLLEKLAGLDFSVMALAQPTVAALMAAVVGVVLLLMPGGLPGRWLALFWLLPLFLPSPDRIEAGQARLTLLDVGQGLAAVLETANHTVLFDTGPRFSSRFDAGSAVIMPFLRQKNIGHVDLLIQSHGDNDHIGGLPYLLVELPIERILTSVADDIEHASVEDCQRGQLWSWDGVTFEILHPGKNSAFEGNDRSCVLKVSIGSRAILLTGDIELKAEQRILGRDRNKLASTILIAPHHGSRTSSSTKFIAAVDSEFVLFPVGYRNRFAFPKKDIIQRYQERGVKILDTARHGAIEMHIGPGDVTIRRHRQDARRFWHMRY
jgi:competence protein ComEC